MLALVLPLLDGLTHSRCFWLLLLLQFHYHNSSWSQPILHASISGGEWKGVPMQQASQALSQGSLPVPAGGCAAIFLRSCIRLLTTPVPLHAGCLRQRMVGGSRPAQSRGNSSRRSGQQ